MSEIGPIGRIGPIRLRSQHQEVRHEYWSRHPQAPCSASDHSARHRHRPSFDCAYQSPHSNGDVAEHLYLRGDIDRSDSRRSAHLDTSAIWICTADDFYDWLICFGVYYHFIATGSDNAFTLPASSWTLTFQLSAWLLAITELGGAIIGLLGLANLLVQTPG